MFKVNEIKSWAKKYDIVLKKQGDGYVWNEGGEPQPINQVVKDIYNKITDGRFVEYQKNYRIDSTTSYELQ